MLHLDTRCIGALWGPSGADRTQVGPKLSPCTLLSEQFCTKSSNWCIKPVMIHGTNECIFVCPYGSRVSLSYFRAFSSCGGRLRSQDAFAAHHLTFNEANLQWLVIIYLKGMLEWGISPQLHACSYQATEIAAPNYAIITFIHSGKAGNLYSLILCSLWSVQIVGYVLACRSYSFVCTLHNLIIIIVQTLSEDIELIKCLSDIICRVCE